MGKYRRYKNRVEMFLASEKGKRILNFCYSWGASIVIIGALFKLLHLPYGNQILFVAMTVEALVFFVSAFERPDNEYRWEEVFPVLKSKNPLDRPDFSVSGINGQSSSDDNTDESAGSLNINFGNGTQGSISTSGSELSSKDSQTLSDSIKKFSGAADQISKIADLTEATQKYLQQLTDMSQNMQRFSQVTGSLADVSDGISQNSRGYVDQMESLNKNIASMNALYDMQMRSVSSQMESLQHINSGLGRIREMYDGSVVDSSIFRNETEKMTRQLAELNQVYGRMLQAMTVNMGFQQQQAPQPTQAYQQYQQPSYQQPYGYQQAPNTNNPMK